MGGWETSGENDEIEGVGKRSQITQRERGLIRTIFLPAPQAGCGYPHSPTLQKHRARRPMTNSPLEPVASLRFIGCSQRARSSTG